MYRHALQGGRSDVHAEPGPRQGRRPRRTGTMVNIKLPDGSIKEYPDGVRPREVAEGIGKRLAEAAVAAVADGSIVDRLPDWRPGTVIVDLPEPI